MGTLVPASIWRVYGLGSPKQVIGGGMKIHDYDRSFIVFMIMNQRHAFENIKEAQASPVPHRLLAHDAM